MVMDDKCGRKLTAAQRRYLVNARWSADDDVIADVARRYGVVIDPDCRRTVIPQGETTPLYHIVPGKGAVLRSKAEMWRRMQRMSARKKKFAALAARNERDGA